MSTKRRNPEQIVSLLRKFEVEIANGKTTPQAARGVGICFGKILARRPIQLGENGDRTGKHPDKSQRC